MTDPIITSTCCWVSNRPSPEEINQAITELQDMIGFAKIHGVYVGSMSVEKVLRWIWTAGQIPMEWLESELRQEYLNGLKKPR